MSLRHGVVVGVAFVVAVVACASTQELSDEAPALGVPHPDASPSSGGETASGGNDGSGGAQDTTGSGGSSAASSSGGTGESASGGYASSNDAGSRAHGGRQSGGATASGGARSSGGSSADAGDALDGSTCPAEQKLCPGDSQCRVAAPAIGCDPAGPCTPCAGAPANGFSKCTGTACDFDCLSGFRRNAAGTGCESDNGAGGTGNGSGGRTGRGGRSGMGGSTSTGGSTANCNARDCPDCQSLLEEPCCHRDGTCGCGLLGLLCAN